MNSAERFTAPNAASSRLYPPWYHPRYFVLTELRRQLGKALTLLPTQAMCNLLDYGCGNMPYQPLFTTRWPDLKYNGADLVENPYAAVEVAPGGQIHTENSVYDIVLSTQVLEHVIDPVLYLKESLRVLKKDGYLLLSTHGYWMYHPDPTDYWRWTGDGLRKLIADSGFRIIETLPVGNRAAAGAQLIQDSVLTKFPRFTQPVVSLFCQILIRTLASMFGGTSKNEAMIFLIVAQKA